MFKINNITEGPGMLLYLVAIVSIAVFCLSPVQQALAADPGDAGACYRPCLQVMPYEFEEGHLTFAHHADIERPVPDTVGKRRDMHPSGNNGGCRGRSNLLTQ